MEKCIECARIEARPNWRGEPENMHLESRRDPIGTDMDFYACNDCGTLWLRKLFTGTGVVEWLERKQI